MAAGGGTFTVQNKVLPGAYINFVSKARAVGTMGERGTIAFLWNGDWGEENKIITVESEDFQKNSMSIFGYNYTDDKMIFLREVFKGAKSAKIYFTGKGTKASAVIGKLTITAVFNGTRGNSIKIVIEKNADGKSDIYTLIGKEMAEVDVQSVSSIEELKDNDYVRFSGNGDITETAGTNLSGGTNGLVTGNDYSMFLDKVEAEEFTSLIYAGNDEQTKSLFADFTKRLREDEGYKITTVLYNYKKADFEGVISVKNNILTQGIDESSLVYWVGGKNAGAEINESLTNQKYDGELEINTSYKKSELKKAIENGEFIFYSDKDEIKVLKDINTFVSVTPNKNSDFSNNQVIRVIDAVANDTARIFDTYYLGKVQNNDIGRDIFKSELINYHQTLQSIQAITNFKSDDIEVTKGVEKGDVIVNEFIEPVGAMDKLYMTCVIE